MSSCRREAARGFSLLELALVAIVVGTAATILLNRFLFYQEVAEKANVEYTISAVKSGLRAKMASLLVAGRAQDFAQLARQNPMDWFEIKPTNYGGLLPRANNAEAVAGNWYFDPETVTLVYFVKHGAHFAPDGGGLKQIRLKVVLRPNFAQADNIHATDSVAVQLLERVRWLEDSVGK